MAAIDEIIERHATREGPLLPILHDVQAHFGCVTEDAIRAISYALNLTRAEIYGTVSFYHDFKATANLRRVIKLCRAEACQARGVEALVAGLAEQSKVKIEPVYCLGLCAVGPAAMVGGKIYARLDTAKLAALVDAE